MDIYTRVENLENLVNGLIKNMNLAKSYTDADIAGVRQNITEITPYKQTQHAYFLEKEKIFYNVPEGNISVFFSNYHDGYTVDRIEDRLIVTFNELYEETDITIIIQ